MSITTWHNNAQAARIEELCTVHGVRPNQLIGYGLVVGLGGTGDRGQARFTVQSTASMLRRLGATIDLSSIQTKNTAAVVITATLPPYANPGIRIDVVVSSLGNASSLEGGTLLQTPLMGADRKVYAVAQGPLVVGGFSAGSGGASVKENHTTVARVPQGAIIERGAPTPPLGKKGIVLQLRDPSFVTAQRIVDAINQKFGNGTAKAVDSATIRVKASSNASRQVSMIAELQLLVVEPDAPVRVVIDERTGTVVLGAGLRISEVAIAQGGLTVEIRRRPLVSQPNPLAEGETAVVAEDEVRVEKKTGAMYHFPTSASLSDVVVALNSLGASPRNLISILQALRTAGALRADIEIQ